MAATDLYLIRKSQQWVKFSAVMDLTVTTPADEIEVWSSEFRDIFSSAISITGLANPSTYSAPGTFTTVTLLSETTNQVAAPQIITENSVTATPTTAVSDETAHEALRQTALKRTCWKFDYGAAATPRYGYAFVLDGDIVSNNPPETV